MGNDRASLLASLTEVSDPILRESLQCLLDHFHPDWGDRGPLDVLNRLLAKNLKPPGACKNTHTSFRLDQISARRDEWATRSLAKLRRGHDDPSGIDVPCPIILVEYDGETRVIDGNHRINRWHNTGDTRNHAVNILKITGAAIFVVLPSRTNGA